LNKTISILLIEDEVITGMSLIMDLKKYGYINATFVSRGEKAIKSSQLKMPDLIIADVSLSRGESGIDVAEKIRGSGKIPIIITSGYEIEDYIKRMSKMENVSFIQKPVSIQKLVGLIESF
jgi:DNA-binding NtrC family response regulator